MNMGHCRAAVERYAIQRLHRVAKRHVANDGVRLDVQRRLSTVTNVCHSVTVTKRVAKQKIIAPGER
jgi:hypothetical protein